MATHVVQSPEWGKFKTSYGTPSVRVGKIQYTLHKIPFTNDHYGYCPRVNPFDIDFEMLRESAKENGCITINFDVPNVVMGTGEGNKAIELFEEHCTKSPRDQFAKGNVLVDISASEDELLARMYKKHRYNIRYAEKHGVTVRRAENDDDFETFFKLYKETSDRQGYYSRPHSYLKKIWDMFHTGEGMCEILTTEYKGDPLASWLFLIYDGVLYYPYGGSSELYRNLHGSTYLAWEAMKLGKEKNCNTFDMWGTAEVADDPNDPYYGFTTYKLKFGGKHVVYIDSYDFVINPAMYHMFNTANTIRWKLLKVLK